MVTYHKQYPVLDGPMFLPVHVGRETALTTKDGRVSPQEREWLDEHLIGDNTGDNISKRNREFCECTGLYWFWKNYDFAALEYVGNFQYRRQLILNDRFEKAKDSKEKQVYKCVRYKKSANICKIAGLNEQAVLSLLQKYDCILPYRTELNKMGISSSREDYLKKIPGVHYCDLLTLESAFCEKHPEEASAFREYLDSPNKLMYQIFITKPEIFQDYCEWLFDLLFYVDTLVDTRLYTVNGKRTMGYLAEFLYGYYFTAKINQDRVLHTGVTLLE